MSATDWLENQVLAHVLGIAQMPVPAILYAALCTDATAPTDAVPGTEVSGGAYARMAVTFGMVGATNGEAANLATLQWAPASTDWGDIPWVELWDSPAGGTRYFWLPLIDPDDGVTPITVQIHTGDIMRIPAGLLIVTAD